MSFALIILISSRNFLLSTFMTYCIIVLFTHPIFIVAAWGGYPKCLILILRYISAISFIVIVTDLGRFLSITVVNGWTTIAILHQMVGIQRLRRHPFVLKFGRLMLLQTLNSIEAIFIIGLSICSYHTLSQGFSFSAHDGLVILLNVIVLVSGPFLLLVLSSNWVLRMKSRLMHIIWKCLS